MFVDSDDAITSTALEELYSIAKNFDADVVYCEKYYQVEIGEHFTTLKYLLNEKIGGWVKKDELLSEPKLFSNNPIERIKAFSMYKFFVTPWSYFIRRNLIQFNHLKFPELRYGEDNFFDLFLVCLAKNLVRVPNAFYIYRIVKDSISTTPTVELMVRRMADHFFQAIDIINKFAKEFTLLETHVDLRYELWNFLAVREVARLFQIYEQIPAWQLDEIIRRELEKVKDKTSLTAFLFSRMNVFNVNLNRQNAMLYQMNAHIQKQNEVIKNLQAEVNRLQQK